MLNEFDGHFVQSHFRYKDRLKKIVATKLPILS